MSPYDQQVYDAGYKYIPQSQYLLNPFQIPQSGGGGGGTTPNPPEGSGLSTLGDGINFYNTDMSKIRSDYKPDYGFRRYSEYGMNPSMADLKQMDMNQSYFYDNPSAMQQKMGGLMSMIPGVGPLVTGANILKDIFPFDMNRRAIMENEARGKGIFTDDIGRIVTDDYNTVGGIMAGYNLNKIDKGTFDKRRGRIEKTLGDKYGLSGTQIEAAMADPNYTGPGASLVERLGLLDEAEEDILGLKKKTTDILSYRQKKKDAKQKAKDDAAFEAAFEETAPPNNDPNQDHDGDGVPNNVEAAGGSYDGGYHGAEGGFENTGSSGGGFAGQGSGASGPAGGQSSGGNYGGGSYGGYGGGADRFFMDGGRVYYMDGGIVDLVDIYD